MKLMFSPLFHLLLCCAAQAAGVEILSGTDVTTDGVIETELKKTVSLVCQNDSNYDPQDDGELVWLRNDAVVSLKDENKKGRSSVCVAPIIHEDNGAIFTCHLSTNTTVRASVTLNVTYQPELSGSENVSVEEEAHLVLQCDIRANPPVSSVSWTLNGSKVDLLAGGFTVTTDGFTSKLSTNKAEKNFHEGTYQCLANSPKYGEQKKLFHVTLTAKTMKFPLFPIITGLVVVCLTAILAIVARWKRIVKCCTK
ncbi:transmembrane and immunoglobulin domain-containing protein 1 [Chaetodon trifascialis]|uniref:transmembrane and immunoglobulin domain-containing protein 1 n=1 Tax=Chaetodon trifascialis TaxID=109706 RepID=UPI0039941EE4